jgi:nitrogen fixation/metabolism regulation signal transduction histidine kinase
VFGGFLAYVLSDSITRSLSVLSDRFRTIRLGMKNEPIQWKSNDEIGVLVSKYNEMIGELEQSADMLAKSEREMAWREMAKQIAHEIKNPLTPMKLSIQMLQKAMKEGRPDVPQLSERVSNTLIEQIDNLSQIATAFSSFAKMPQTNAEALNIEEIIQSSVNLVSPHDDFEIQFNKTRKNILVYADKNQLLRAFGNLIKNAQQSIPDNKHGKMIISMENNNQHVIISFKDNGSGIPEDIQSKVFTPNFTTKNSGMGLGLAITKQAIEEGAKGKIWFETKADEGTTFFVKLPIFYNS